MILRIGTRASKLALAQSGWVKAQVEARHRDVEVVLVRIKTKGDRILDSPLSKVGGKGLFVKEIEDALLRREVDLAVHSMKDVPGELPDGLELGVFPEREDPRDAYLSDRHATLKDLPEAATVGTSSLRRAAQLLHMRPDLRVVPMRGNVDTRIRKMQEQGLGAIILAAAGMKRLGLSKMIRRKMPTDEMLPAIGQGALGLELRREDREVYERVGFLNHETTALTVRAERAFLKKLQGGCQVPIAGYARLNGDALSLEGLVAELDGKRVIRDAMTGPRENPEAIGIELAERVLSAGADRILAAIYSSS